MASTAAEQLKAIAARKAAREKARRANIRSSLAALFAAIAVPLIVVSIPVSGLTVIKAVAEFAGLPIAISSEEPKEHRAQRP